MIRRSGVSAASDRSIELVVRTVQGMRIPRPAHERPHQDAIGRRPVRPLRRQPRRRQDAGLLDARHDEPRAIQPGTDVLPSKCQHDGGGRCVRNFPAESSKVGVDLVHERSGRERGRGEHDGAGRQRRAIPGVDRKGSRAAGNHPAHRGVETDGVRSEHGGERAHHLTQPPGQRSKRAVGRHGTGRGWLRNWRRRLPCVASISTKRGNSDRTDKRPTSPAWIPARSGSAR